MSSIVAVGVMIGCCFLGSAMAIRQRNLEPHQFITIYTNHYDDHALLEELAFQARRYKALEQHAATMEHWAAEAMQQKPVPFVITIQRSLDGTNFVTLPQTNIFRKDGR